MSNKVLPEIEHANVTLNERNRVIIQMHEGWVFYRLDVFPDGAPTEKKAYSNYGVLSLDYDYSNLVVIAESEIPEEPETPEVPEEPETETQATETDYITALEELGVQFNG